MMHVYYDEPHAATIVGPNKAKEFITLSAQDFGPKLTIYVKEGSLLPKDPLTKYNQAIELWAQGALDPETLFTMLDFANPHDTAKKLFLWKTQPQALFPDIAPPQPVMPQQAVGPGRPQVPGGEPLTQRVNVGPVKMTPLTK